MPTIAEQLGTDFDLVAWFMLYAPAATPEPVLARLREAADAALVNPDVQQKLRAQGVEESPLKQADLDKAEAKGDSRGVKDTTKSIETYTSWLDQARVTLAEFTK